jgi:hypothetical protein
MEVDVGKAGTITVPGGLVCPWPPIRLCHEIEPIPSNPIARISIKFQYCDDQGI